jgi:hypothetical protein
VVGSESGCRGGGCHQVQTSEFPLVAACGGSRWCGCTGNRSMTELVDDIVVAAQGVAGVGESGNSQWH